MSVSSEKVLLALDVIDAHFGGTVTPVARRLLHAPLPLPLRDAVVVDNLSPAAALVALGVLFQHNLLLLATAPRTLELSAPRACLRLAHARFLHAAQQRLGVPGEVITGLFLEHGRLSESALRVQLASRYPTASPAERASHMGAFHHMTSGSVRYIVPCLAVSLGSPNVGGWRGVR